MKRFGNLVAMLAALALFLLCIPPRAHAYLDLGTGSLLLQVLVAFLLGAGVAIRIFWKNIRAFFLRLMGRSPAGEDASSSTAGEAGPDPVGPLIPGGGGQDEPAGHGGSGAA